jgi:hypothetical protein
VRERERERVCVCVCAGERESERERERVRERERASATDGRRYEGEWKDDTRSGRGVQHAWPDGGRYEGAWRDDARWEDDKASGLHSICINSLSWILKHMELMMLIIPQNDRFVGSF